jgi:multidrug resistance efflux pump
VASGADIGIVENPRVDTSRLDSLESRRATATEDLSNAKRDVIRSEDDIRRLDAEISKARRSMLDMAETEKVGLDADVLANESDFDASSSEYERLLQVQQAQNNGSISRRDLDRARGDRDRARGKLERSKSDQRRLAMKIEALRAGLFPDGDQPMEIGFIAQEKSRLADRQARVTQIETDIKGLDNDIVLERERVEKLRKASITAPTSGIIWRRSAAPGQSVRNGDELCSVAQDGTIRVEAWVNPSHSSSMSVGDGALVRVVGSEIPREGVVEEILPPGAYRAGSERAWQPAIKNDRLIRVVIKVDGMEGRIGNHASVMVTGQNPGILKRWAHALVQWSSW